ncbi:hypothetical protein OG496_55125 [Streptomyces sp. NBC_00988]|nr:hypothetical protein OG496_55125 [Streptomyces sp. NBC_00988]
MGTILTGFMLTFCPPFLERVSDGQVIEVRKLRRWRMPDPHDITGPVG